MRKLLLILMCMVPASAGADYWSYHAAPSPMPRYELPTAPSYNPYLIMYRQAEAEYYRPVGFLYGNPGRGQDDFAYQDRLAIYQTGFNALMAYDEAKAGSADYTGDPFTDLIALPFKLSGAIFGNLFGKNK